ncbi:hypothetical protein [Oceanospirillum sediminis]|uniref:Uncharacterized protein n=1 Tax=Oceanospirillum sediminis TaxID=2760088 RepID=A0A839ILF1_9GAMM|nr:hypothetical protein [Oceanospirillum sediminis]MBB1485788.1 hypothetical protein [Oceanospirillum sediminis]
MSDNDTFPSNIKFIIIRTIDPAQSDKTSKAFTQWVISKKPDIIETYKCSKEQFSTALKSFGVNSYIPPCILQDLYSISSGNLKLAKLIAGAISDGADAEFFSKEIVRLGLLRTLLTERFKHRDENIEIVLATLKSAALIGMCFDKSEAACLISKKNDNSNIAESFAKAKDTGLIDIDGEKVSFSHPVIVEFVRKELTDFEVRDLSLKLAQCLRALRPADYNRQADLFLAAGNRRESAEAIALYYLKLKRSLEYPEDHMTPDYKRLLYDFDMFSVCEKIGKSYELFGKGDYDEAREILKTTPEPEEKSLALEMVYTRSLCRVESGRCEEVEAVALELEKYLELEEMSEFVEISTRFRLLHQQALVLSGAIEKARLNSISLMSFLRGRIAIDSDARLKYYIVLRKSNSIHDPFVAYTHLKQAVSFFKPKKVNELPEYPLEYYRTLVNKSGVEIQLGLWRDACITLDEAIGLVSLYDFFVFPRLDVALNNLNLARCREKLDSPEKSVEQQTLVVAHNEALSDNFHHNLNLIGMMILANNIEGACSEISSLEIYFSNRNISEQYITFHLICRKQVISYLNEDWELCNKQQKDIERMLNEIDWPSKPALLKRTLFFGELIKDKKTLALQDFDTYFINKDPSGTGPSWPHFGRGVLFSELQFWSDS